MVQITRQRKRNAAFRRKLQNAYEQPTYERARTALQKVRRGSLPNFN